MGVRIIPDIIIVQKIGDIGTFKQKLERLVQEKYIAESAKELLEIALSFGNATIHRGYLATREELSGVMDIIENVLRAEALTHSTSGIKNRNLPKIKKG